MENTHGFDDREFYASAKGLKDYASLERNMRGWNERWNESRHTKKLGWRTPNEVLEVAFVRALCFWLSWCDLHQPLAKLSGIGVFEMSAPKPHTARKPKRPKHKSAVDRYLAWMEGEEKKSLKLIIAMPAMSQNSSAGTGFIVPV